MKLLTHKSEFRADEEGRIGALEDYRVLYTEKEPVFDQLTALVKASVGVEIATITMIDTHHQWLKSIHGLDARGTPRAVAFCDHTIRKPETLIVTDTTKDPRFSGNPLVTGGPKLRSYLGAPIRVKEGYQLGAMCAIGLTRRTFSQRDIEVVEHAAEIVVSLLEMRREASKLDPIGREMSTKRWEALLRSDVETGWGLPAVALLEVDDFNEIVFHYGSKMGDRIVSAMIDLCVTSLPEDARVARLSHAVIGIVLPGLSCVDVVSRLEALRGTLGDEVVDFGPDQAACSTVTVGAVRCRRGETISHFRDRAMHTLAEARALGPDSMIETLVSEDWPGSDLFRA